MRIFHFKERSKSDCMEISPQFCLLKRTPHYLVFKMLYRVKRNGWDLELRILLFQEMNHNLFIIIKLGLLTGVRCWSFLMAICFLIQLLSNRIVSVMCLEKFYEVLFV